MVSVEGFFFLCLFVIDVDHLDLVDLRPLGSVRAYVASFGSVCSYVWMMCGLLSQLLYSACLFGIPIYMLLVSTVMLH
jgi:hypothetical protein